MAEKIPTLSATVVTAPGDLGFVHAFLNTWGLEGRRERFEAPERMTSWLRQRSLIDDGVKISRKEFEEVLQLRRALRAALSGRKLSHEQLDELAASAKHARLSIEFNKKGEPVLGTADGTAAERLIGYILSIVYRSAITQDWDRMKVCANDECQAVFFDRSKNRSGVWCSSKGCGNRLNARAYRARL